MPLLSSNVAPATVREDTPLLAGAVAHTKKLSAGAFASATGSSAGTAAREKVHEAPPLQRIAAAAAAGALVEGDAVPSAATDPVSGAIRPTLKVRVCPCPPGMVVLPLVLLRQKEKPAQGAPAESTGGGGAPSRMVWCANTEKNGDDAVEPLPVSVARTRKLAP